MHLSLRGRFFIIGAIVSVCFLLFFIPTPQSSDRKSPGTQLSPVNNRKALRKSVEKQEKHGLNVTEGREHLSEKSFKAFAFSFHVYGHLFDWFLKADDDTYVIVENLRSFLSHHDPNQKLYFGYRFKPLTPQGFMSGGAGYVLSSEALGSFVRHGILGRKCQPHSMKQMEDVDLGACLSHLGVRAMDTIDSEGRERFHPLNPISYIYPKYMPRWLFNYTMYPVQMGGNCCSEETISFHYVRPAEMYIIDLLLYRIRIARTFQEKEFL